MTERLQQIALGVVCFENRLLLIERKNIESRGNQVLKWALPGGKFEPGEDQFRTVIREVSEETGYQVEPTEELYAGEHPVFPVYVHYIACRLTSEYPEAVHDSGICRVKWIRVAKLTNYITSTLNDRVQTYLDEHMV